VRLRHLRVRPERLVIDRKGPEHGPLRLPRPFLCVLGAATPDMLLVFQDEEGRQDGFLDRLLIAWPDGKKYNPWSDADGNEGVPRRPSAPAPGGGETSTTPAGSPAHRARHSRRRFTGAAAATALAAVGFQPRGQRPGRGLEAQTSSGSGLVSPSARYCGRRPSVTRGTSRPVKLTRKLSELCQPAAPRAPTALR
jgi:hypothetical protein